jgi:tetratricopeptide (TPR) repeat protein
MLKRVSHAKEHFSKAIRINPRVPLQKELGWMALEAGSYPHAISMLNDHLQRDASDYEACNFLIQCFFDTGRYELGLLLAKTVIAQKPGNDCFENNRFLCELMANEASPSFLDVIDRSELVSPFARMNFDIATESDACWSRENGPSLK